jgi:quercetin dioxygenase-like cupin family protein
MKKIVFENPKIKDRVTVIEGPEDTNNAHMLLEIELQPKGGNALHYHTSFSEEFIPLEGPLGVQLGKQELTLLPGQTALVAIGQPHRFFNQSNKTVRFMVKIVPANEGFLQSLRIAYGLATDGLTNATGVPKKLDHLSILTDLSDTRLAGGMSLLNGLFLWRAKKLKKNGKLTALLKRYA